MWHDDTSETMQIALHCVCLRVQSLVNANGIIFHLQKKETHPKPKSAIRSDLDSESDEEGTVTEAENLRLET